MTKFSYILIFVIFASCRSSYSIIKDNVNIDVYTYEHKGKTQASAMPELRSDSHLKKYNRRFEYLLINVSKMHQPESEEMRKKIWNMYPDTSKLKRLYLNEFIKDKELENYFKTTYSGITNSSFIKTISYTEEELMEVASKFFYCDKIYPDTTVQSHVCVGLNGVSEANWNKDYTLLEAFCYEAIFNDLVKDTSQIDETYSSEKIEACNKYKSTITTLDEYLLDVRDELFERMKNDPIIKIILLEYYEENKNNLAFELIK